MSYFEISEKGRPPGETRITLNGKYFSTRERFDPKEFAKILEKRRVKPRPMTLAAREKWQRAKEAGIVN